ncbi:MAG: CitMHS family transporter [Corynebacterium sp.]|uniref:CitMHS family transporter n=1 Tax=unclassified Corynebacterium TaxID=2624378 RepID=UPI0026480B9C|nr:citrate:proton symporter [Corynebacterium sp.]MDN5582447.1 citrate:proton symporter [Corynebacterium sp.]MDN5720314.1 citrate:proton symporter [Corynebacterium sp.]MDN6325089.1 citrate:proton symporter [Corynebacterium sp.]
MTTADTLLLAEDYNLSHTPSDGILVALGFLMILTFMALIMTSRMTPMLALILVPTVFGLIGGAGLGIGDMVIDAVKDMAPTAALLMFAIMYFGIMINVGLFDPLITWITRILGNDPAKIVFGTAVLAGVVSLDGDGSTTYIITTSAMLPLYLRLGMSPVILTCVAGLVNGTMNIVPWGGPTVRAAAALGVEPSEVFVPMLPSLAAGLVICFVFAWLMGLAERKRLGRLETSHLTGMTPRTDSTDATVAASGTAGGAGGAGDVPPVHQQTSMADTMLDPNRASLRPTLLWFNLALTVVVMVLLVADLFPLAYVFMVGAAIALTVNFPRLKDQANEIVAHSSSIVAVVGMVLAAGVLVGVLDGTGMVTAMAEWITGIIPDSLGGYLAPITGLLSMPMTFFMSNDAFYFGILPVLSESAAHFGIEPVQMAQASITGQPVHMQSPLVPAILLLVSLANVDLGAHHRKVLWRAVVVSLVMLAVGILLGPIPFHVG